MTGTPETTPAGRIRWEGNGYGGWIGYAGTINEFAFQVSKPTHTGPWMLSSALPGCQWSETGGPNTADGPEPLKAEAERRLERFAASIGAVFPAPASPPPDPGEARIDDALAALGGEDSDFLVRVVPSHIAGRQVHAVGLHCKLCPAPDPEAGQCVETCGQIELWELVVDARAHYDLAHGPDSPEVAP